MPSDLWRPLEEDEAIPHGRIIIEVVYHDKKPARIKVLAKEPQWTEQDVKKSWTRPPVLE